MNLISCESDFKCKAFHMKISFVRIKMKTNFHNKNYALSLALTMRLKATRKWPIKMLGNHFNLNLLRWKNEEDWASFMVTYDFVYLLAKDTLLTVLLNRFLLTTCFTGAACP